MPASSNSAVFKKADISDLEKIYQLAVLFTRFNAKNAPDPQEFFFDGWEKSFKEELTATLNDSESVIFYAELSGEPTGYAGVHHDKYEACCVLDELYVDTKFRGQKIGEVLVLACEDWCKNFSDKLKIEVYNWNTGALTFYERLGYNKNAVVFEKVVG